MAGQFEGVMIWKREGRVVNAGCMRRNVEFRLGRRTVPVHVPLYQEAFERLFATTRRVRLRKTAVRRLALLITGMVASRSCVVAQIALELFDLGLTRAHDPEHIERRVRRTLRDLRLTAADCYVPMLRTVLDWTSLLHGQRVLLLSVDDTSQSDHVHLLRIGLQYWGGTLPLAWAHWQQNVALPNGAYWAHFERLLAQVALVVPAEAEVVVLADRAFDVPLFIDHVTARGWHYVVRAKINSSLVFRDRRQREQLLGNLVRQRLEAVGERWKSRGFAFKDAGWRPVSVVATWASGHEQRLVVLTDLPVQWKVLRWYRRRFWIEAGFRQDKRKGWQWESSQVRTLAYQERLLLAMAWASLLVLCVGVEQALAKLAERATHPRRVRARHPHYSIFSLGLRAIRQWLTPHTILPLPGRLPQLDAPSWDQQWVQLQRHQFIFGQTVRP